VTAFGSIESAVEAMKAGAFDYVTKPINQDALRIAVSRAIERQQLRAENRVLRERVHGSRGVDRLDWRLRIDAGASFHTGAACRIAGHGAFARRIGCRQGTGRAGASRRTVLARKAGGLWF
jgi:ActR/RegA family two-component response regulator